MLSGASQIGWLNPGSGIWQLEDLILVLIPGFRPHEVLASLD